MFAYPTTPPTYRTLAPRPLATKQHTFLSDIEEHSPNPDRSALRALRSVSVASFLSDGTIEIDGFGFDNVSEFGDDSLFGGESLYGDDDDPPDLSRRAEKILASAKRRLDLCGQNISRARSSLILSPSATPTALHDHLVAVGPVVAARRTESAADAWRHPDRADAAHARTESAAAAWRYPERAEDRKSVV